MLLDIESHPAWVCGLKLRQFHRINFQSVCVTPCVGVWIETKAQQTLNKYLDVTPCVGVWIETLTEIINFCIICHTLRGCVD